METNTQMIANKRNAAHRDPGILSCRTHHCIFVWHDMDLAWPLQFGYRLEALQRMLLFVS
jgi:hypothetical protein